MSSGDKILNRISLDCDERISQIGAETDEKCAQIMAQAKLDADKISAEIADRAQSKVKQMQAASKSRCDLETRNAFLKRRREEIDKTYSEILNKMKNLPDEDYFELIYTFAKKLNGMSGVVLLNEKDMNRLPKDFLARLEKCGVKAELSKMPCDIESGFILKCGDIEENMDFSAILSEKRDAIEDFINQELFKA
ncbi:V-type ATP synthase subunit E [Ruminococcus bromii]|uniref:V-type ATP synthase subunit E n=1 Tax=Ruminococcus bromii TaxID=40518 RepID=UPI003FD7FA26